MRVGSDAAVALNRFGLGARGDEPAPETPRRWLLEQFDRWDPSPPAIAAAPARPQVAADLVALLDGVRGASAARAAASGPPAAATSAAADPMAASMAGPASETMAGTASAPAAPSLARLARRAGAEPYQRLVGARIEAALESPAPFVERLVHFWANHFAVSVDKRNVTGLGGLLEIEAIRPRVLGRFSEMLQAVARHPAMLLYLDQTQSVGPASRLGARAAAAGRIGVGLNENLAREILELHTLGVRSGYGQADVLELARALTGWTVSGLAPPAYTRALGRDSGLGGEPGRFVFVDGLHEPGPRTILGRSYAGDGEAQAAAVLEDLAAHPATARHVANRLARHFAASEPPPELVSRLERAFLDSGGDLPTVYRALVEAPEPWAAPGRFRTPWDWTLAAWRGLGARAPDGAAAARLLTQLGQPAWRPGSPAGFDDTDAAWIGPEALVRRVEAAEQLALRIGGTVDAGELAERLLPAGLSAGSAQALARAESGSQALALLLASPEFLRR
jgi:uncharacterized protein (DUF1800 family)